MIFNVFSPGQYALHWMRRCVSWCWRSLFPTTTAIKNTIKFNTIFILVAEMRPILKIDLRLSTIHQRNHSTQTKSNTCTSRSRSKWGTWTCAPWSFPSYRSRTRPPRDATCCQSTGSFSFVAMLAGQAGRTLAPRAVALQSTLHLATSFLKWFRNLMPRTNQPNSSVLLGSRDTEICQHDSTSVGLH